MVTEDSSPGVLDTGNPVRPVVDTAAGKGGKGAGHFQRTDARGAQGQRVKRRERAFDAAAPGRVDNARGADLFDQLGRHGIDRLHQGQFEHHWPGKVTVEVARLPVGRSLDGNDHRLIHHEGRGRQIQFFKGRVIGERLETRARLALIAYGPIVGRLLIGAASHEGAQRSGFGVDGREGALGLIDWHRRRRRCSRKLQLAVQVLETALNRFGGVKLQAGVEGRVDLEAAVMDDIGPVGCFEIADDHVEKIAARVGAFPRGDQVDRGQGGGIRLGARDISCGHHPSQDDLLPLLGPLPMPIGVIARR